MEDLCERIAASDERMRALYAEHLHDHGELLAHVFFGDVTRHYEALCASGQREQAGQIVACVDEALAVAEAGSYVDNVIHVSFLEALPWQQKTGLPWELLTPRLKAGYDQMHRYNEPS
jgi:hypothetical protein